MFRKIWVRKEARVYYKLVLNILRMT